MSDLILVAAAAMTVWCLYGLAASVRLARSFDWTFRVFMLATVAAWMVWVTVR